MLMCANKGALSMKKILLLLPMLYSSLSSAAAHEISTCSNYNGSIQLTGSEDGFELRIISTKGIVSTYSNKQVKYMPRIKLNTVESKKMDIKCDKDVNIQQFTRLSYFTEGFTLTLRNGGQFDIQDLGPVSVIEDILICRSESYELGPCDK